MKQQTLAEAWDDYCAHARSMGIKETTMTSKRTLLRPLLREHGDRKLHLVSDKHVAQFFLKAAETRAPRSLATTHAHLNVFYNYCVDTGRLKPQQNVMLTRRKPKFEHREQLRVPVHKWPQLLSLAQDSDPRDRALVALGLYTLLRDQEMACLRIRDVDLSAGTIRARIPKSETTDLVAISTDLDVELRRWYSHYQHLMGPLDGDMLLLPARRLVALRGLNGKYESAITSHYHPFRRVEKSARVVTPLLKKMGYLDVDDRGERTGLGAHTLRRSGARAYYDHFVASGRADALRVVQTMLHHKNAEMTQHYIGLREDRQTRDQLVRGVTIFGLHNVTTIGGQAHHNGDTESHYQVM